MTDIWTSVKVAMKMRIPEHACRMWIEPIECLNEEGNAFVIACPNHFFRKRILENYASLIESELRNATGNNWTLVVRIREKAEAVKKRKPRTEKPACPPQLALPQMNTYQSSGHLLRKEFTFDRFVVGKNNDFAYSAALSLASRKDKTQNPLFLLSQSGMGKSHLSQAIGHHIIHHFPKETVFYVTAEDFTNEMVHAFRNNSIEQFKEKYRRYCDVLLLEDVHFLTGKERTQTELALALDYLLNAQKKIIFTSCYLPSDIPKLNDQLRSRLSGGIISGIEAPDYRTRIKILEKKMAGNGCQIPRAVAEYLAGELSENVRQLESGLICLTAKASLTGVPVDMRLAESVVRNMVTQSKTITIDLIKDLVSEHYNIPVAELVSKSRKKNVVLPRQMAIYLARKYTDQPLQSIGRSFNRYHATIIHSVAVMENAMKTDRTLKSQVDYFCEKIERNERGNPGRTPGEITQPPVSNDFVSAMSVNSGRKRG
ncbi:MAG: chromosomal replication initiator protein DnaA [Desulfococcaceae bacterium]